MRRSAGLGGPEQPRGSDQPGAVPLAGTVALLEGLGRRWYRLACTIAPVRTASMDVVGDVAERFGQARRILNILTERHLFPFRSRWMSGS